MLTVEHVETAGWGPALRGMRNPLDSWERADSTFASVNWMEGTPTAIYELGDNDETLMRRLIGAGSSDHCKFRRMLVIWCDVMAPLYWWKEADQYKVGTVTNSCSTMHTIMRREFTREMFSWEDVDNEVIGCVLGELNHLRRCHLNAREAGDDDAAKVFWRSLIQQLPSSWNQRRTLMLNYEVMANVYRARRNHKLKEWHDFIDAMLAELPHPWIFTGEGE